MKAYLARFSTASWTEYLDILFLADHWTLSTPGWYVVGPDDVFQPRSSCSPCPHWRRVNLTNLLLLCRVPQGVSTTDPPAPARICLVNARSLVNKTFILNDFFTSRGWMLLNVGESSAFSELLPHGCCYFEEEEQQLFIRVPINVSCYRYHPCSPASNWVYLSWVALTVLCAASQKSVEITFKKSCTSVAHISYV